MAKKGKAASGMRGTPGDGMVAGFQRGGKKVAAGFKGAAKSGKVPAVKGLRIPGRNEMRGHKLS